MELNRFVDHVRKTYTENLEAIVLYGSAASEDFSKKYSDFNTIIVLKEVTPGELEKGHSFIKKWVRSGNPAPLFFDHHHINTSSDVFPIEFHDIQANRKVLYGEDPFSTLKILDVNLRHQCECELKGKILQLQSRFVEIANKNKEVSRLMMESLSTFISIFRGIVRLLGQQPEQQKKALVEHLSELIGFSPNIFLELLDVRDGNALPPRQDAIEKFEDYLEQLKTITVFVDQYKA